MHAGRDYYIYSYNERKAFDPSEFTLRDLAKNKSGTVITGTLYHKPKTEEGDSVEWLGFLQEGGLCSLGLVSRNPWNNGQYFEVWNCTSTDKAPYWFQWQQIGSRFVVGKESMLKLFFINDV